MAFAQDDFNLELIANVPYPGENGNDIWGYVDQNGIEYALCGARNSTKIFSLLDPTNPQLVVSIPGEGSTWRDLKTYNNHVYVTTDQGGTTEGLLIIDMTDPTDISWTNWNGEVDFGGISGTINTCHNLYIDDNGICYLAGCGGIGRRGIIMLDLNIDPKEPVVVGVENSEYAHDVYTRGDTMYVSQISANPGIFSIYDIADKANPILLSSAVTSNSFTHNAWVSTDGKTLFTTDEVADGYVDAWDISDMANPVMVDKYQPIETQGNGVVPHNTHVLGDYIITSWYTDGVVINDVCDPSNMIKVAAFDTFDGADGGFSGCWGVYPYLPSGLILANDINTGLYVLRPSYVEAARLEGTITDEDTGQPINGVTVEIIDGQPNLRTSSPTGEYKTGNTEGGIFSVRFSKFPEYEEKVVEVLLIKGIEECNITTLNTTLKKRENVNFSGVAVRNADGIAIPGAKIFLDRGDIQYELDADGNGSFGLNILTGTYEVVIGAWGYLHKVENLTFATPTNLEFRLDQGYQDDFLFDLGWTTSSTATIGDWERGVPQEAFFNNDVASPGEDVDTDLGESAFITGNVGGVAAQNDVDNGEVTLMSDIMDLTIYTEPVVQYRASFYNAGGTEEINDTLTISITNGIEEVILDQIVGPTTNGWTDTLVRNLVNFIDVTDQMQLIVKTSDLQPNGHIVKAGFDEFFVGEGTISSVKSVSDLGLKISPNPTLDIVKVVIDNQALSPAAQINIMSINGKLLNSIQIGNTNETIVDMKSLARGIYLLNIIDQGIIYTAQKIIKL